MLGARGSLATNAASRKSARAGQTALLVMKSGAFPLLCPFFSKCDGVLLVDPTGRTTRFHPRDRSGTKSVCDLVLELHPRRIICGFIDLPEKKRLRAAGIDVRLGSCNFSIEELVTSFQTLPEA